MRNLSLFLLLASAVRAAAADLVLDSTAPTLANQPLKIDGQFAGLVGDPLTLPDGKHQIQIKGEHFRSLDITVTIAGEAVSIDSATDSMDPCANGPIWKVSGWGKPTPSAPDARGLVHLPLPTPQYKQTPAGMNCLPSSLSVTPAVLTVLVTTTPPGSKIYVDANFAGQSDITLSVPYYPSEKHKRFLLRSDGYFPCSRDLALPAPANTTVSCNLRPVRSVQHPRG